MDLATAQPADRTPSPSRGCDDPHRSLDRLPVAVVAQRRIMKAGVVGSPLRRSPRLSCLPPPQLPVGSQNMDIPVESTDDEAESINDVALHLSRDETPEIAALLPDEPSTVLAKRIIGAHDNPSPPPRDLALPGIVCVPDQSPHTGVSIPPSPFRPINIVERLNQFSDPLFDPPQSSRTPSISPDISKSGNILLLGSILPPSTTTPNDDLESANTIPSSPSRAAAVGFTSRPTQHVCQHPNFVDDAVIDLPSQPIAEFHGQLIPTSGLFDSQALGAVPIRTADPSTNHAAPSDELPQGPHSEPSQESFPLPPDAKILSPPLPNESDMALSGTETIVPGERDLNGEDTLSIVNPSLFSLKVEQESKYKGTNTGASSHQGVASLSPCSTKVLRWPKQPASSTEETTSPAEFIRVEHRPATPPRTRAFSVTHPDFSRTGVQRPINAPSPMRAKGTWKSPVKFTLDDISRTPAQRVPIETALVTPSLRGPGQLSTEPGQSRPGQFMTIRAPVFTRPALEDPTRSPAKRVPITETMTSPTRKDEDQNFPTQFSLCSRSTSVEPRPLGAVLTRSRSAEPYAMISNPHYHGRKEDSIFPMVPTVLRAGAKLPFPIVHGQKSSNDIPVSIPEVHENAENGGADLRASISRLRKSSVNSRIPRIGNQPYARPRPESGKEPTSTKTIIDTRTPRPSPFQLACKNSRVGKSDAKVFSAQPGKDQRLVGSLKRKRGAEATPSSGSHPVVVRQVVPGIISDKYGSRPTKFLSQVQVPPELSPFKVHRSLKFRKVVDGMLSARYAKANLAQTETSDSASPPPSPLSELSSSSNEGSSDEKHLCPCPKNETPQTNVEPPVMEPSPLRRDTNDDEPSNRPRRTSRTRKPAQQQYVIEVFNGNASTQPPPARRKSRPRSEGGHFMGMSTTALKALTTSNTTKNQQTVAVLATEVIRKEGLRPESPTVKARTILQKQRDERDVRRREREQRKAQMSEDLGSKEIEGRATLDDRVSLVEFADYDEDDYTMIQKHPRGPGEEEDYETPERPGQIVDEGVDGMAKPVKQVKWHRGLSTAVYLDEVHARPTSLPKNTVVRGCLASAAKNLPLDPLGNLVDINDRPSPELVTEQIVVKRYLYDNDIDPEAAVPTKMTMTRSKSKKSKS